MKTTIFCKRSEKGPHDFYLSVGRKKYYLFTQDYRKGVDQYFAGGVLIDDAIDYSKSKHDSAIEKTMTKIPVFVKYIEKEYGIKVMDQTKKKG